MTRILLTDPEQRASLAAARSLGARGWRVETIGVDRGLAGVSRFVDVHHSIAKSEAADPHRYRSRVADAVAKSRIEVIVPVSDAASRMLLGYGEQLGARLAGPSAEAYGRASDKQLLMRTAATCGIRVPRQSVIESPAHLEIPEFVGRASVVIKPARSIVDVAGRTTRVGVRYAASPDELRMALAQYPAEAYPLLLQERIVGDGVGVFLLRHERQVLLRFAHRRLREKPPSGGVSTYREAIEVERALEQRSERLLDALDYDGAAMIEYKQDARSGDLVLMEINARLWGSVQLAVDAGVDFPAALVDLTIGNPVEQPHGIRNGIRTVWELGELDHALALLRRSREELQVPDTFKVGFGAACRVLTGHRSSDRLEVLRWYDPAPFAAELWRWVRGR